MGSMLPYIAYMDPMGNEHININKPRHGATTHHFPLQASSPRRSPHWWAPSGRRNALGSSGVEISPEFLVECRNGDSNGCPTFVNRIFFNGTVNWCELQSIFSGTYHRCSAVLYIFFKGTFEYTKPGWSKAEVPWDHRSLGPCCKDLLNVWTNILKGSNGMNPNSNIKYPGVHLYPKWLKYLFLVPSGL
jgi:hypothetical protein